MRALLCVLWLCLIAAVVRAEPALPCARFGKAALPAPESRLAAWPLQRLAKIDDAVKTRPYRVLFLGDSLVEHFEIGAGAAAWHEHLAPRGVLDGGVSGDRTEHLLWRLDHGTLDGPPPRLVVVLIGTNDLGYHRTAEETADGIRAVLLRLRERLPRARILLLGLWPRGEAPESQFRGPVSAVNRLIAGCADGRTIVYAEPGQALLDADGRLAPEIAPDHLHPSSAGYARLAPRLAMLIDKLAGH